MQLPDGALAVAVSGGVDSLCALILSLRTGRDVLALHARLWDGPEGETGAEEGLALACRRLGVPLHTVDLRARFAEAVVRPFVAAYRQGLTPNPCTVCNRRIKFGAFLEEAGRAGAAALVTGHYAALDHAHAYAGTAPLLWRACDVRKDQSYFLGLVRREQLSRVAFPLAGLDKRRVREIVAGEGLQVPVPRESQEICFVPQTERGYRDVLEAVCREQGLELPGDGDIVEVDSGRVLGRHHGLWQYTEGQRQGLGIAWKEPLYVLAKRTSDNVLLVGNRGHTLVRTARIGALNWMIAPEELPATAHVRLRYRQPPMEAGLHLEGECLHVTCASPLSLSAPGQLAVVYDDDGHILVAGCLEDLR